MKITQRIQNAFQSFAKTNNTSSSEEIALSREFLKYGSQKPLVQDWSKVVMSDKELYSGYPYAAITTRANKLVQLATENLETETKIQLDESQEEDVIHPYLQIIDTSTTFSNQEFWYNISTYLDLVGVYYLMAVRNVEETTSGVRVGNIQSFKLLNPYDVRRIINEETGEVGGYVESKNNLVREIKPQMIIEMRKLNPFSSNDPYAMTDAAKEYQFALKQAGDYTRHSLKNNMAAPGIISTDVILDREQFQNFVARITNQEKGLPLFGNGAGSVTWDAMQINLDNASLDKITEINRSTLFAVSGVSKTLMAIEESGTTRETSRVQKDLFLENHIIPQLQLIIDALNQDYKNNYPKEYERTGYCITIDNPLKSDKEAESVEVDIEIKEINARSQELDLYNKLVQQGYDKEVAAQFSCGDISIEELSQYTPKEINPSKEIVAPKEAPKKPEVPKEETKPEDSMTPTETDKEQNANPYRDKKGQFSFGPGGSDKEKTAKKLPIIRTLNPTGGLLVEYTPNDRVKADLADNITTIDKTMGGSPDDIITIYRGAPKNQKKIVPGDFITDMPELAMSYTGDNNVLSLDVRKGDVLDDMNEPLGNEYIYRPNADKEIKKKRKNELDIVDNGKGNPNRDKLGRFTWGVDLGDGSSSSGKAKKEDIEQKYGINYAKNEKEAMEKIKGSKYTKTLYHGTVSKNVDTIKEEGFNLDKSTLGRMYGNGIYLTSEPMVAKSYSSIKSGEIEFAGVLKNKIKVKNPAKFDTDENVFTTEAMDWGIKNDIIPINKYVTVDDMPPSVYGKLIKDYSTNLLKKHDAIIIEGYFDTLTIVKDPKNVFTFNGPPKGDN